MSPDPSGEDVDYVERLSEREEGDTPAILGDIRAATGFLIKEMAGPQAILDHEIALPERATERLERHPRIRILGPRELSRLPIIPIEIEGLHHELASTLLDHLSRARPTGHQRNQTGLGTHFPPLVRLGGGH